MSEFLFVTGSHAGSNKLTLNMDSTDTQSPISPCRDGTILNIILEIRDNTDIIRT